MAKDNGIVIKFNKDLAGDVSGLSSPFETIENREIICSKDYMIFDGITSPGTVSNAFINTDTGTYWNPGNLSSGEKWCSIDFGSENRIITKFQISIRNGFYTGIFLEGSIDGGATYERLFEGTKSDTVATNIYDLSNNKKGYSKIRIVMTGNTSAYVYVYNIKLFEKKLVGNERAFSILGKEREYLNGPLIDSVYKISSISRWLPHEGYEGKDYIILKLDQLTRFRKPEGDVKVIYKKSLGRLAGTDGSRVDDFERILELKDIVSLPNPAFEENVKTSVTLNLNLIQVDHRKFYIEDENIKVSSSLGLTFTNVTGMYP